MDVLRRFRKVQENGAVLPMEPELMAQIVTGALIQLIRWRAGQSNPIDKDELVNQLSWVLDRI